MDVEKAIRVPALGSACFLAAGLLSGPLGFAAVRWWLVSAAISVGLGAIFGLVPQPAGRKLLWGMALTPAAGVTVKLIFGVVRARPGWTGELLEFIGFSAVNLVCLLAGYLWMERRAERPSEAHAQSGGV